MIDLGSSERAKVRQNDIRAKSTIYLTSSFSILFSGSEAGLLQSADYAVLITNSTANGRVAGQIDGVDPIRNPGKFRAAWVAKNYHGAFVHELGHLFGARRELYYHILHKRTRGESLY